MLQNSISPLIVLIFVLHHLSFNSLSTSSAHTLASINVSTLGPRPITGPNLPRPWNHSTVSPESDSDDSDSSDFSDSDFDFQESRLGIIGGDHAASGEWPMLASIQYKHGHGLHQHFCGGTIWNKQWILTAAHCLFKEDSKKHLKPLPAKKMSVYLSQIDLTTHEPKYRFDVSHAYPHPSYRHSPIEGHDIALVKLSKSISFKKHNKKSACACTKTKKKPVASECYVVGWGHEEEGGEAVNWLRETKVPLREKTYCAKHAQGPTKGLICAGHDKGGKDACQGDSGGPLFCSVTPKKPFVYIQVGIVSYGLGCARAHSPGYYTDVEHFRSWIKSKTGC